jgi:hypothetical protein
MGDARFAEPRGWPMLDVVVVIGTLVGFAGLLGLLRVVERL